MTSSRSRVLRLLAKSLYALIRIHQPRLRRRRHGISHDRILFHPRNLRIHIQLLLSRRR